MWGPVMPIPFIRLTYSISLLIRDVLLIVLPAALFCYIATLLSDVRHGAIFLLISLALFEATSNSFSILYAYGSARTLIHFFDFSGVGVGHSVKALAPYFSVKAWIPAFYSPGNGTISGIVVGLMVAFGFGTMMVRPLVFLKKVVDFLFTKIFAKLLPILVFGFLTHLQQSGTLSHLSTGYGNAAATCGILIVVYLTVLYAIAAGFRKRDFFNYVRTTWPTGVIAFSSSSSAATMPYTIEAARKNLRNPDFANLIIPATTNIQQIGDCIANIFFVVVLMHQFDRPMPDAVGWFSFMGVFVLARYTTAAVMGGAIFIMIPLYESYLGFTPEMTAIILALNVLLDPIVTSSNVMANGALCIIFEKTWDKIQRLRFYQRFQTKKVLT